MQPSTNGRIDKGVEMKKQNKIVVGTEVQWKWMGRYIEGFVREVHIEPITKTIKGKAIKRNGSKENPAFFVESLAGNVALKLQSEVELRQKESTKSVKPKMFG
jgi:hypothetical protein